jgi:4'-phosphopantetheinyl transferase
MWHTLASPHPTLHWRACHLPSTDRDAARLALRQQCALALQQQYGGHWQADDISNTRGQVPQLRHKNHAPPLALSFSYEGEWAVFAWHEGQALGIDLLALAPADWQAQPQHWQQLSLDYLGAAQTQCLFSLPAAQQPTAFAQAWSRHEAALKCLQLPLQEWQASLQAQRAQVQTGVCAALPWQAEDTQRLWCLAWALPQKPGL